VQDTRPAVNGCAPLEDASGTHVRKLSQKCISFTAWYAVIEIDTCPAAAKEEPDAVASVNPFDLIPDFIPVMGQLTTTMAVLWPQAPLPDGSGQINASYRQHASNRRAATRVIAVIVSSQEYALLSTWTR